MSDDESEVKVHLAPPNTPNQHPMSDPDFDCLLLPTSRWRTTPLRSPNRVSTPPFKPFLQVNAELQVLSLTTHMIHFCVRALRYQLLVFQRDRLFHSRFVFFYVSFTTLIRLLLRGCLRIWTQRIQTNHLPELSRTKRVLP